MLRPEQAITEMKEPAVAPSADRIFHPGLRDRSNALLRGNPFEKPRVAPEAAIARTIRAPVEARFRLAPGTAGVTRNV